MALITTTTQYDTTPGMPYIVGITGHNGHTTTIEYYSEAADEWIFVSGTSSNSNFGGEFLAPSGLARVTVASGSGDLDVILTAKLK